MPLKQAPEWGFSAIPRFFVRAKPSVFRDLGRAWITHKRLRVEEKGRDSRSTFSFSFLLLELNVAHSVAIFSLENVAAHRYNRYRGHRALIWICLSGSLSPNIGLERLLQHW